MRAHLLLVVTSLLSAPAAFVACSSRAPVPVADTKDASAMDSGDPAMGSGDAGDASSLADADTNADADAGTSPIVVSASGRFAEYLVSQAEFDAWNSEDMSSPSGVARMQTATKAAYQVFHDVFDFVVFTMNNTAIPSGRPAGQSIPVKNTVAGLGLSVTLDDTATYGSAGQLQSVSVLYQISRAGSSSNPTLYSYLWLGPSTHEIGHRWFNYAIGGQPHWPSYCVGSSCGAATSGVFGNPANDYAQVELYMMGLLDGSAVTDADSVALYQQVVASQGPRSPGVSSSQKSFRGLVLVVTTAALTAQEVQITDDGVDQLTRSDGSVTQGCNFYRQTGGRATLQLDGLASVER
jgi:hypothetical protein